MRISKDANATDIHDNVYENIWFFSIELRN